MTSVYTVKDLGWTPTLFEGPCKLNVQTGLFWIGWIPMAIGQVLLNCQKITENVGCSNIIFAQMLPRSKSAENVGCQ